MTSSTYTPREGSVAFRVLEFLSANPDESLSADEVATAVEKALSGSILDLTDTRGRRVVVPSAAIGYIEIGAEEQRRVGFGTV